MNTGVLKIGPDFEVWCEHSNGLYVRYEHFTGVNVRTEHLPSEHVITTPRAARVVELTKI